MNVAVGGVNGYFPDDKHKPWKNADPRAVNKFWDRRKYWQPSWGSGNQAALAIDSVKIWTKDQSKCLAWDFSFYSPLLLVSTTDQEHLSP